MTPREQLVDLAHNLWWSWDLEATRLWADLGGEHWRAVGHDPVVLLERIPDEALDAGAAGRIAHVHERFRSYMDSSGWCGAAAPSLKQVAYLSMEFGLHESLPLYSGGLGVLAGDHLKSASDLDVPLAAVGLLWHEGYFRQEIVDGRQHAVYAALDPDTSAVRRVDGPDGPLFIEVPLGEHTCTAAVWRLDVGRVPLYLLDANTEANPPEFRALTRRLYDGDRLLQEVLLGLGAIRLLDALKIEPQVIHLNEGHCAFAPFQAAANELEGAGSWAKACELVRERFVFTTHTPVPAGHDRFGWTGVNSALGPWRERVGLHPGSLMDLGRVHPHDLGESLCMTVVALRLSAATNGVSKLHGEVSRDMWKDVWPGAAADQIPIGHITNGVHSAFWVSEPTQRLFDRHLEGWRERPWEEDIWADVDAIPDDAITSVRNANRQALLDVVKRRAGITMDPDALTIGFARRFAPYKRGDLIFTDPDRLAIWLGRGAQIVYAGKAHPRDARGQAIVARVVAYAQDPRFAGRVVLVPDYDIEVGRAITAGADVWLNNPRRPREASGTSGQKVVYNGGLNLSVLDGWWPEGYDGTNGWAIGDGRTWSDVEAGDAADVANLYELLENEVWPTWTDRAAWCERIRRSWKTCAPQFSSHRMVRDYVRDMYAPRTEAR